jgi:hypothetical protein
MYIFYVHMTAPLGTWVGLVRRVLDAMPQARAKGWRREGAVRLTVLAHTVQLSCDADAVVKQRWRNSE